MARRGRRLTIGGSGLLSEDDTAGAPHGETRSYIPKTEEEQAAEAERIAKASIPQPANVIITVPRPPATESGGDAPGAPGGEGPGPSGDTPGGQAGDADTGGGPGPGGDDGPGGGEGDFKRGGPVGPQGGTVEAGEYVMPKGAVAKYGHSVLEALRSGKAQIAKQSAKRGARLA